MKKVIFPLAIVAFVCVVASASWYYGNHSNKKSSNSTLSPTTEFTFKELGLKVQLPAALNGLTYDVSNQNANPKPPLLMRLKLNSFSNLANKCLDTPANTYQNFATVIKLPGNYDNSPDKTGEKIKQFKDYYLADVGSSLPKDLKCTDKTTTNNINKLNSSLKQSLIQAFDSAQKA